jgi:RNA methyltransferase, TrmH family
MIKSRHNPLAQRARAARDGRADGLIFVEGLRLCEEAARSGLAVSDVLYTARLAADPRGARLLEELRAAAPPPRAAESSAENTLTPSRITPSRVSSSHVSSSRITPSPVAPSRVAPSLSEVSDDVLASVSDTKTPQGVVLLARRPATDLAGFERALPRKPLVVVLHRVNNPANAGAMLRVAEAAGAAGVVATEGTADLLSAKSLRGAMGSAFRLPLWAGASFREVVGWCARRGVQTVSTDLDAELTHTEIDWTGARAILCGPEASGLTPDESAAADLRARIPMRPPVESLNVAVALAVVLYEAARQRGFGEFRS